MKANELSIGEERVCVATSRQGEEGVISGHGPGYRYFRSNSEIPTVLERRVSGLRRCGF